MDYEAILNIAIAVAPALTSIIGVILSVCQFLKKFRAATEGQNADIESSFSEGIITILGSTFGT